MPTPLKDKNNSNIEKNVLLTVKRTLADYRMFQPDDAVLVGVSGGPDSVALLYILHTLSSALSIKLGVAHLNHCLRQQDSDNDADFVASIAEKLDLPFYLKKEEVRKHQLHEKLSLEEASRKIRYAFYDQTAEKSGFNKIALGHHCRDNAELVLMNIFRGSGPLGISGIPTVRGNKKQDQQIVRPLIRLSKSEIINYLTEKRIEYVSDKSNMDTTYLRNRVRHHLIPILIKSYNPKIIETLNRLAVIMETEEEWLEKVIHPLFERCVLFQGHHKIIVSVSNFNELHLAAKRRVMRKAIAKIKGNLRRITFAHIDSAISLLESENHEASLDLPDRIRIKKNKDILIVSKEKTALRDTRPESGIQTISSFEYKISIPENSAQDPELISIKEIGTLLRVSKIEIESLPDFRNTGHKVAFFDIDTLNSPLILRNVRPGDRFTPLGMNGTQKVKKYFIDKKVHKTQRKRCPVLLSQGKIIWVGGHRIDESAKITALTRNVLKVELG